VRKIVEEYTPNARFSADPFRKKVRKKEETAWLVLPYHMVWLRAGITAVIDSFNNDPIAQSQWKDAYNKDVTFPKIKVSWRNAFLPFHLVIRKINAKSYTSIQR